MTPQLFSCTRLSTRLTRSSCVKRHRADRPRRGSKSGTTAFMLNGCGVCPVGAAHAAGEDSGAQLVTVERVVTTKALPKRACMVCGAKLTRLRGRVCSAACGSAAKDSPGEAEGPRW